MDLNSELVRRYIESMGHQVETAASGEEAISACAKTAFDLILMDIRMPGLDGLAATQIIRANEGPCASAPIVALSAGALPEQVRACHEAGMNGHLAKPVKPEDLAAAIARWTGERERAAPRTANDDLKKRFRARLIEDRQKLIICRDIGGRAGEVQPLVHRLAGSAGSFGFEALGATAGVLNDALEQGEAEWRDLLDALIERLDVDLAA